MAPDKQLAMPGKPRNASHHNHRRRDSANNDCEDIPRDSQPDPVDFDSVPKFQERDLPLGQSLKLAIWDIGLLALFNLVFFAVAFVSFLRYDVR